MASSLTLGMMTPWLAPGPETPAFAAAVLERFASLFPGLGEAGAGGFVAEQSADGDVRVEAGIGRWRDARGLGLRQALAAPTWCLLAEAAGGARRELLLGDRFMGCFPGARERLHVLYLEQTRSFTAGERDLIRLFAGNVAAAFDSRDLHDEITATQRDLILTLGVVVEGRSPETAAHVVRVGESAALLALRVGLDYETVEMLRLAASMHDVGKVGVPDRILQKPGRLTDAERAVMQTHTTIGWEILNKSGRRLMQLAATVALQHHERWDGCGYPRGLRGEDIDMAGRIVGLVDVLDALSHRRAHQPTFPLADVLELIARERARHFDPELVDLLLIDPEPFAVVQGAFAD